MVCSSVLTNLNFIRFSFLDLTTLCLILDYIGIAVCLLCSAAVAAMVAAAVALRLLPLCGISTNKSQMIVIVVVNKFIELIKIMITAFTLGP